MEFFRIVGIALGDPAGNAFLSEVDLIVLAIETAQGQPAEEIGVFHRDTDEEALALAERRRHDAIGK